MKYLGTTISVLLFSVAGFSQGLLNNGAFIVSSGAAQIYIAGGTNGDYLSQANGRITPSAGLIMTLEGDWTNNGGNTGFTADAGTVVLNGAAENISGSSSTTFYNLTLQGSSTKTLNVNTNVGGVVTTTGVLSIGTRPLILNSFRLTITNPVNTAVTYSSGYVMSETNAALNPSIMQWNTGAFATAYVYPFGTAAGLQIPLTYTKTIATASDISIATRPTATSANLPWASTVTQMYDPTLLQDGSDEAVIDRWWEITSVAAMTADVTFRYSGAENTLIVPYNTGNLGAQYWAGQWVPDNSNIGSAPAVLAGVGAVTAPGVPFAAATYTPMVLSSLSAPLPVELLSLTASCNKGNELVAWSTASEVNNDFFTIERSDDGITFHDIGTVNGNGTTSQMHYYSFSDPQPVNSFAYYRLRQTDFNGHTTNSGTITAEICASNVDFVDAFSNGSEINILMNLGQQTDYTISVFDARGRLVINQDVVAVEGSNKFSLNSTVPATGIYLVNIKGNNGKVFSKRLFISVE